jgi:hypothetical protein
VFVFDAALKKVSFRPIFLWSTVVSTVLGLTQLMLVFRTNVALGIPDWIFCLGESAVLSIVGTNPPLFFVFFATFFGGVASPDWILCLGESAIL